MKKKVCFEINGKNNCYDPKKVKLTSEKCNYTPKSDPKRWAILVFSIVLILLSSMLGLFLRNYFNTDGRKEVNLMHYDTELIYTNGNGEYIIDINPNVDTDRTEISVTFPDSNVKSFSCNYTTGKVLGTDYYSILWIPLQNSYASSDGIGNGQNIGSEYLIYDTIDMLGNGNKTYTLTVKRNDLWWTTERKLLGVQHSLICELSDGGMYYGEVIVDSTSGLLEESHRFTLKDYGSYPSSRHRVFILTFLMIAITLIIIGSFIRQQKKNKSNPKYVIALSIGLFASFIDLMVDVWFYAWITIYGVVAIHFAFALVLFLLNKKESFIQSTSFIFPIIIELAAYGLATYLIGAPTPEVIAYTPAMVVASMIFSKDGMGSFRKTLEYTC